YGMIQRIGFAGYSCAHACVDTNAPTAQEASASRPHLIAANPPLRCELPAQDRGTRSGDRMGPPQLGDRKSSGRCSTAALNHNAWRAAAAAACTATVLAGARRAGNEILLEQRAHPRQSDRERA